MKIRLLGALLLALAPYNLLADSLCLSTAIDLTFKPRPESGSYVELVRETEEKVGASPLGPERVTNTTQLRGTWRDVTRDSRHGHIWLTHTFDRVKISADMMGQPVHYDSDTAGEEESKGRAAAIGRPMLGKKLMFTLISTMNGDGLVQNVEGMDELLDAVEESAVGNFLFAGVQNEFDDKAAAFAWVETRLAPLPKKPVSVGDTWTASVRQEDMYLGSLVYEYACRLSSMGDASTPNMAKITYTGKVIRPSHATAGVRIFNTTRSFKSGEFTGHALYDMQRGEVVSQETVYNMSFAGAMMIGSLDEAAQFAIDDKITETYRVMTRSDRKEQRKANREAASQPEEKTEPAE